MSKSRENQVLVLVNQMLPLVSRFWVNWTQRSREKESILPHRTRRTGLQRTSSHNAPLPHLRGWCTSPAGTLGCGAPSSWEPLDSWWPRDRPYRSSHRAPEPVCPARPGPPSQSVPGRWPRCCWGSVRSSPTSRSWCRRRRPPSWTTRIGPGSGRACTWASWRTSSEEGTSRPHSSEPRWEWEWKCRSLHWRRTQPDLERSEPRSWNSERIIKLPYQVPGIIHSQYSEYH